MMFPWAAAASRSVRPLTVVRRARGFTMIELLVVVTVLGIVGTLIVPRMTGSISREVTTQDAAAFVHTARMVRELAVARHENFAIDFDERGYIVQMKSASSGSYTPLRISWLRPRKWGEHVKLEDVRVAGSASGGDGTQRIEFRPDGSSGGATLRLTSGPHSVAVIVESGSGRARYGAREQLARTQEEFDLGD